MFYTVYQTTCIVNGKVYVGVHKTKNLDDSYLGSGLAIKNAIKKYGKNNFSKKILFVYDNSEDAYQKEKEIVSSEFLENENVYNLVGGGSRSTDFYPNRKYLYGIDHPFFGKHHTQETKKSMSNALKGRKQTQESIQRRSASLKGRKAPNKGTISSPESNTKRSLTQKNKPKIKCPHCSKETDAGNSKQWHFDNCKLKPMN